MKNGTFWVFITWKLEREWLFLMNGSTCGMQSKKSLFWIWVGSQYSPIYLSDFLTQLVEKDLNYLRVVLWVSWFEKLNMKNLNPIANYHRLPLSQFYFRSMEVWWSADWGVVKCWLYKIDYFVHSVAYRRVFYSVEDV